MFVIRIKIKGYLQNNTEKTKELIDVIGIKNKNNINYTHEDTTYKLTLSKDKVILLRENTNYVHKIIFETNKTTNSEYHIKEYDNTIYIPITVTKINVSETNIDINYIVNDTQTEYIYKLEMSEK